MNEVTILAEVAIGYSVTVWMVQGTDNRRRTYYEETLVLNGEQIVRVTHKKAVGMEWMAKNSKLAGEHMLDLAQDKINKATEAAARKASKAGRPVQMSLAF